MSYIKGKTIMITGGGSGFGELMAKKAAARGAKVSICDVNAANNDKTVAAIKEAGGEAIGVVCNVAKREEFKAFAAATVEAFGRIDVLINNAGIMPLAYWENHHDAIDAWEECIDVNLKGTLIGMHSVYDQMIKQGSGHVINFSSIYANWPVIGASVYQATKIGVRWLAEGLRKEAAGKIKVSVMNPTGVSDTNLRSRVVNSDCAKGIRGTFWQDRAEERAAYAEGDPEMYNPESMKYWYLEKEYIAEEVMHIINQPLGVVISDVTVRSTNEEMIL